MGGDTIQTRLTDVDTDIPDIKVVVGTDVEITTNRSIDGTVEIHIDDLTLRVDKDTAQKIGEQVTQQALVTRGNPGPALIASDRPYKRGQNSGTHHLNTEYSCGRTRRLEASYAEDLNLVHLVDKHCRDTDSDSCADIDYFPLISQYVDAYVCTQCARAVTFWHTQRRVFLTQFATTLPITDVTCNSFTDVSQGDPSDACSLCGTPDSAFAKLDPRITPSAGTVGDITPPYVLCGTCRDLLVAAQTHTYFEDHKLDPENHPLRKGGFIPQQPVSNPKYEPPDEKVPIKQSERELTGLPKHRFVSIVEEFEDVSSGTAERLYEHGYDSIPGLRDATKSGLSEVALVGGGTAGKIRTQAADYVADYRDSE